jgi:hypothetical protein
MNDAERRFGGIRIAAFTTVAAIVYGVLHDLVTAHLCVEYFAVAHPPVFPTRSPILLALGWGIIATWWVGLALGIGLAMAARIGSRPRIGLGELRRPIIAVMLFSAAAAVIFGALGAAVAATNMLAVPADWARQIPPDRHVAFIAAAWAHEASYLFGALGGLIVIIRTIRLRRRALPG